jgi:hypothetical protein
MFIVSWKGRGPADRAEWIAILREALSAEMGSYRVSFFQAERGWRFTLDYRPEEERPGDDMVMANSPETVAFNIHQLLSERGKPIDPTWVP